MITKQEDINNLAREKGQAIGFLPDIRKALKQGMVLISVNTSIPTIMLMLCPSEEHYHVLYFHDNSSIVMQPESYTNALDACLVVNSGMDPDELDSKFREHFTAISSEDFDLFMEDKAKESITSRIMKSFIETMIDAL